MIHINFKIEISTKQHAVTCHYLKKESTSTKQLLT